MKYRKKPVEIEADTSKETYDEVTPWDDEAMAESIAYNKRVYDTFRDTIK